MVDTLSNLLLAGQVSGALIAILSLLGLIVKYGIVKPIKAYIDQMTYAIQPYANGGKSLPDLIHKVDQIKVLLDQHIEDHDTPNR